MNSRLSNLILTSPEILMQGELSRKKIERLIVDRRPEQTIWLFDTRERWKEFLVVNKEDQESPQNFIYLNTNSSRFNLPISYEIYRPLDTDNTNNSHLVIIGSFTDLIKSNKGGYMNRRLKNASSLWSNQNTSFICIVDGPGDIQGIKDGRLPLSNSSSTMAIAI